MGVERRPHQAGVPRPRLLTVVLLLAALLLWTLKVDTVEHLICCVVCSHDSDEGGRLSFKSYRLPGLARDFSSVGHHGSLLLVGGNLNVVAIASIITVPK